MKDTNRLFIPKGRDIFYIFLVILLLTAIYCCVGIVLFFYVIIDPFNTPPTEQAMIENFHSHRAAFDQGRQLFLYQNHFECPHTASHQTPDDYSTMCHTLSIIEVTSTGPYGDTWFEAWNWSSIGAGRAEGYVYTPHPDRRVVDHIDTTPTQDLEVIYQHLDGNWYLYESDS